jgi:hypothetical protein
MPASPADADFGLLPQVQIVAGFDAADSWVGWGDFWSWLSSAMQSIKSRISGGGSTGGIQPSEGGGSSVPELDMTVAGSAIVLLLGGVAYIASRRREQQ